MPYGEEMTFTVKVSEVTPTVLLVIAGGLLLLVLAGSGCTPTASGGTVPTGRATDAPTGEDGADRARGGAGRTTRRPADTRAAE